ncbi:MAG: hypothetical protein AMJ88_14220 [Anaerolineae bacterium SM23_ 63]|nr:MAG: hypothetical protein AMJ88_14220 [Anaerolineae bacterium SM23_ 63]HEY48154.1 hypothetical protein [Anaerolineae bacterium]
MITPGKVLRTGSFHLQTWWESHRNGPRLGEIEAVVASNEPAHSAEVSPVLFFNASTRTWGISQNAAFGLLASWGLRLNGVPVRYFVCNAGLEQCVLGTVRTRLERSPPCNLCKRLSHQMYPRRLTDFLDPPHEGWDRLPRFDYLNTLDDLREVEAEGLPLGELCFPSLRWILRRHNINDTEEERDLYRKYLRAGMHLARSFEKLIHAKRPRGVVVFNGVTFPEAIVRQVALKNDVPVVTHEVGVQPFSAFFSHGEATAYPIDIGDDFILSAEDEAILDEHLSHRFRGTFSMAGVQFWPEMHGLDEELLEKAGSFRHIVAVFTNVIFDTSQIHANTVFHDMFDWLRQIVTYARGHPETLFVVRAHPDELRKGKESLETVEQVLDGEGAFELNNLYFIAPKEYLSSYELIKKSKQVLVYNSSIGLEATLLGKVVLCAGKSRYSDYPTAYFPATPVAYFQLADRFINEDDPVSPEEFVHQARRFTYYQNFFTSLDFSPFLTAHARFPGYLHFSDFNPLDLHIDRCEEMRIIHDGILEGKPMVYQEAHISN